MLRQYRGIRDQIRLAEGKKEYQNCINLCYKYLKELSKENPQDTKEDLWYCYFMLGKCNFVTKEYMQALEYTNTSLYFFIDENAYISSIWLKACVFVKLNHFDDAIKDYNICINYYKVLLSQHKDDISIKLYLAELLHNVAYLQKDISTIYESIKLYKSIMNKTNIQWEQDQINCAIDNAYKSICTIYIMNLADYIHAQAIITKISDRKMRADLKKKILAISCC